MWKKMFEVRIQILCLEFWEKKSENKVGILTLNSELKSDFWHYSLKSDFKLRIQIHFSHVALILFCSHVSASWWVYFVLVQYRNSVAQYTCVTKETSNLFGEVILKLHTSVWIEKCLWCWYARSTLRTLAHRKPAQCWFSTVSQPAPHPAPGSHGTGRKACMCASALIQQFTQSVSQPACSLRSVPSYSVLAWPGLAWPGLAASAALQRTIMWIFIQQECTVLS